MPIFIVALMQVLNEVTAFVRWVRTTTVTETVHISRILDMDCSGEGSVDMNEYVMYMLESTGQVDLGILRAFEHQFYALDKTQDGHICMDDFPEGMGLKQTTSIFNGQQSTLIEVVEFTPDSESACKLAEMSTVTAVADRVVAICNISTQDKVDFVVAETKRLQRHEQQAVASSSDADGCVEDGELGATAAATPAADKTHQPAEGADTAIGKVQQMGGALFKIQPLEHKDFAAAPSPPTDSRPLPAQARSKARTGQAIFDGAASRRPNRRGRLRLESRLAAEFDENVWDYGTVTDLGVAPARRGTGLAALSPLRAGHVSARVTFLDGEAEWYDFDPAASVMYVLDGWVPYRFVEAEEFSLALQEEAGGCLVVPSVAAEGGSRSVSPLHPTAVSIPPWAKQETAVAVTTVRIMV
jgi:hypothetical protein